MPEDPTQGDVAAAKATTEDMTPAIPQTLQDADAKWNEVMGDDGESFADILGAPEPKTDPAEPAVPATPTVSGPSQEAPASSLR